MAGLSRQGIVGLGAAVAAAGAAAAVGFAADRLATHRRIEDALDSEESFLSTPDRELLVIATDGVPLHVEVDEPRGTPVLGRDGRPVTVVLTHGYTHNLICWVFQRRVLAEAGYRLVLWDQRSHGRSERSDPAQCTLDQLGQDLREVIRATCPEGDLVLVGHSMGGMTMLALGEIEPELVRQRVLAAAFVATSPGGLPLALGGFRGELAKLFLYRIGAPMVSRLGRRPDLVGSVIRAGRDVEDVLIDRFSFGSPVPTSVVRLTTDMIFATPLDVMTQFVAAFDRYDKRTALAAYGEVETLVFNGEQDVLTPPAHSELIVEGIPGAEHVVVKDAGHVIMLEHPDLLNEQLLHLIDRPLTAHRERLDVSRKPTVRRVVTDVARRRRVREVVAAAKAHRGDVSPGTAHHDKENPT